MGWANLDEALADLAEATGTMRHDLWRIADLCRNIIDDFGAYGTYKAMAGVTGYTTRRLRTFVKVARAFPEEWRFPDVPFHLYEVASETERPRDEVGLG